MSLVLLACAGVISPGAVTAQVSTEIRDCETECAMVVERLAILGGAGGDAYVGRPNAAILLDDGSILLADQADRDRLKRFAPDGSLLQSIGTRGEGPGEFKLIRNVWRKADGLIEVYDMGNRRITVMDSAFDLIATVPVSAHATSITPAGESWVVASSYPTRERVGLPLHVIRPDGSLGPAFGADPPVQDVRNFDMISRSVTEGNDGGVWASPLTSYVVERWADDGRRTRRLVRRVAWFHPHDDYGFDGQERPNPGVWAIDQDEAGRIWVMIHRADDNWFDGIGEAVSQLSGRPELTVIDEGVYWDTVIEVVDPDTGRLVGKAILDGHGYGFADDGVVFTYEETEGGEPRVSLWKLTIGELK